MSPMSSLSQIIKEPQTSQESSSHLTPLKKGASLTVIIPAYNEEKSITDTIRSLQAQTLLPQEIIVVDDCSTDSTAQVALRLGVTLLQPLQNTGSKAGAQNFALQQIHTEFTMAIDADTTLAPDAIAQLVSAIEPPDVAAACGFVIPRYVQTVWERGRYIEYLFTFSFFKPIQNYYEKPLISSGCFSIYRTDILKKNLGWSTRTLAEDMDLTWSFYFQGLRVLFVEEAVCYPIEPHNFNFMSKQLKRWSHGFVQNVQLHWPQIIQTGYLRFIIAVALWDAVIASFAYLFLIPVLTILLKSPWILLGYFIDIPTVLIPTLFKAVKRKEAFLALTSIPSFLVLRTVNCLFMLEAVWTEVVRKKRFSTYEKGH